MENLIQRDIDYLFDAFLLVAPPSWFPALDCSQQIAGRQAEIVSFGVLVSDPGSLDKRRQWSSTRIHGPPSATGSIFAQLLVILEITTTRGLWKVEFRKKGFYFAGVTR
jgi:hypothetical protein